MKLGIVLLAGACLGYPAKTVGQTPDPPRPPGEVAPEPDAVGSLLPGPGLSVEARAELERQLALRPLVFEGDIAIPRDSLVPRGILLLGGTLYFQGRTPGSVTVVGGDLYVRPGAEIGGDAIAIGGGLYGSALARVAGQRRVIRGRNVRIVREPGRAEVIADPEREPFPVTLKGIYGFSPEMYNRVDGLAVRWGARNRPPPKGGRPLRLAAEAILRTSRDDIGWEASAEKELLSHRLVLRAATYNLTDTAERWHRGDVETSLAAFFLGEDNRFYFERKGVELRGVKDLRGPLSLETALRSDEYRSLVTQDPLTVASDDFLPNLPVSHGTMRSAIAAVTWEGRDDREAPARGWWGRLEGETAGGFLEGDHSFTAARLDVRRHQPIGAHRLDARVVLGGRIGGTLPEQKRYHLGGAATLPGYEALSVLGDRAALLNLRYRIPAPALQRVPLVSRLFREGAWITLIADAGDAWESADEPDWLGSAGAGLAGRGTLGEIGLYLVVPSERVSPDQGEVSAFLYLGRFF